MSASSPNSRNSVRQNSISSERVTMAFLKRVLTPRATWTHKEEFLDAVYWLRQLISIVIGVILGLLSIKGIFGIATFFAVSSIIIFFYTNNVQSVDPEEYGGNMEIIKEGLGTAFATFLVSWIVLYSTFYGA